MLDRARGVGNNSQVIGHTDDGGAVRIVVGASFEEVLADLLRVDDDDLLVQKPGVDEVTWREVRRGEGRGMGRRVAIYLSPACIGCPGLCWVYPQDVTDDRNGRWTGG